MYKRSRYIVIILQKFVLTLAILGALVPTLLPDIAVFFRVLWILVPLAVIWVITPFTKRYYQIVLLHVFLAGCCMLIAGGRLTASDTGRIGQNGILFLAGIVFSAVRMLFTLISMRDIAEEGAQRLDTVRLIMPVFLFFPAVFLAGRHGILPWYRPFYNILFSAYLILLFLRLYLTRTAEFAEANRHTSQMPLGQIARVNHRFLLVFLAAAAVLFFLMPISHLEPLILWIPQLLLAVLRWVLSRFTYVDDNDPSNTSGFALPPPPPGDETGEGNAFLMLLGEILGGLVLVAAAAAALLAVYRFLSSRIRHPEDADLDVKEFIGADERAERSGKKGMSSLAWYDYSPSGRARRAWIRELLGRKKKESLRPSQSPQELEHAAGLTDAGPLHDLYEKARYSEDGITREEWDTFRNR